MKYTNNLLTKVYVGVRVMSIFGRAQNVAFVNQPRPSGKQAPFHYSVSAAFKKREKFANKILKQKNSKRSKKESFKCIEK